MFTLASGFYENYLIPPEVSLLIIGLDDAGKTTLLERLKVTDFKSEMKIRSGKRISVKPVVKKDNNGEDDDDERNGMNGSNLNDHHNGTVQQDPSSNNQNDRHRHSNGNDVQQIDAFNTANNINATRTASSNSNTPESKSKSLSSSQQPVKPPNSIIRRRFMCPAPRSYQNNNNAEDDDVEYVYDDDENELHHDDGQDESRDSNKKRNELMKNQKLNNGSSTRSLSSNCSDIVPLPTSDVPSTPIAPHPPIVSHETNGIASSSKSNGDGSNRSHSTTTTTTSSNESSSSNNNHEKDNDDDFDKHNINESNNNNNNNNNNESNNNNNISQSNHTKKKQSTKQPKQPKKNYDQKPGSKMFPIHLIRPTLGMNLAKFDACNAKVRLMDLGGSTKMRNLWERYYKDIHGIAFVVDVSCHASVAKLMEARAFYRCMLDDESLRNVPILIFANKMDERVVDGSDDVVNGGNDNADDMNEGNENSEQGQNINGNGNEVDDVLYDGGVLGDTSLLDIAELFLSPPRGSPTSNFNFNNVAMFAGSAKSGEGVRPAFEWLIRMGAFLVKAQRRASMQ